MNNENHELAPATVLLGHVSAETAYVVDDYPYGYTLRCRIRYWLHTADRGAARGKVRLMAQTTNPKRPGEPWNNPKASTYNPWAVMYRDSRGHVEWWPVGRWGPRPWSHLRFRLRTLYDQLNEPERTGYDTLLRRAISADPDSWARAARTFTLIASGAGRDDLRDKHGLHVDERDYETAVAAHEAGLKPMTSPFDPPDATNRSAIDAMTARLDRLEQPAIGHHRPEPPGTGLEL